MKGFSVGWLAKLSIVALALGSTNLLTFAEDELVTIEDFAFLSGYWVGTGMGGDSEEVWMPPVDGRMLGIFKQSSDGELIFSEYMEIVAVENSFVLRLKHFNPDFSGWEEKDDYLTFPFREVEKDKAVFGGLSYELTAPNELRIELQMRGSDGSSSVEVFEFTRRPLS